MVCNINHDIGKVDVCVYTREAELRSAGVYVEKTIDVYLCTRIALLNKDMIC